MPTCLVLVERGGDASLDIVSDGYTEATKSAFRKLIDSNAQDISSYLPNGRSNEKASNFSDTDMELSLTSVVLATSLDRVGIDFAVYDDEDIIDKYRKKLEREIKSGVKFVCISTTFFWDMNHLQKVMDFFHQRDKKIKIILGGQGLSVWGDSAYEKLNNVFCYCYGDIDYFGNYINDLLKSKIPEDFELKVTNNGKSFYVLKKFIPDLDSLFLPDWGILKRSDFNDNYYEKNPLPDRVSVEERRGCVFRCAFCSYHTLNTHRQKSSERIVEELTNLKRLGFSKVNFTGAEFLAPPKKTRRTLELIVEANLKMDLLGYARIDILHKHPDMIDLMAKAGFTAAYFGVESGDQSILKAMDKNFNLEKCLPEVLKKLKKYNIDVWASFIFGFPGETEETIRNTTNFIVSRNFTVLDVHALQVVPGTPLDLKREKYGLKTLGNFWTHPTMSIREIPKLMRKVFVDIYPNCDSSVLHIRDHLGKYFPQKDNSKETTRAIDRCLHELIYIEFNDSIKTKEKYLLKPWNELKKHIKYIPSYILE